MKVFDNIENYDPFPQFEMSAHECDVLISELKRVITDLIPLRSNKRKTREYCEKYLRIDLHRDMALDPMKYGRPNEELPYIYEPVPGEVEFEEKVSHSALVNVIYDDRYSFGYLWNLLHFYMAEDTSYGQLEYEEYSDAVVRFALAFDVEEIRSQAKNITDLKERVRFLNTKYTDLKIFKGLDSEEQAEIAHPVELALKALLDEAEKELSLGTSDTPKGNEQPRKKTKLHPVSNADPARIDVRHRVLYDLSYCSDPRFAELRQEVHGGCLSEPYANNFAFHAIVVDQFRTCYDRNNGLQKSHVAFDIFPHFLTALIDSYSSHLRAAYPKDDRKALQLMYEWVRKTVATIDDSYRCNSLIVLDKDPYSQDPGPTYPYMDTYSFKSVCVSVFYQCFTIMVDSFSPGYPDATEALVPFNMWDADYKELRKKYQNKLGLEKDKRAIVFSKENQELFQSILADNCVTFCKFMAKAGDEEVREEHIETTTKSLSEKLHALFRDFIEQVQGETSDISEVDDALLSWILTLEQTVFDSYAIHYDKIKKRCPSSASVEKSMGIFYLDILEKIVFEIAAEYFTDSKRLPLTAKEERQTVNAGVVSQNVTPEPAAPKVEEPQEEKKHSCTIEYSTLYDSWNNKAFTRTTLEEFTSAIDNADFRDMMKKAEDAGIKTGYIGGIKYIIKNLARYLGDNWYEISCSNLGLTKNDINRLNVWTNQIKKIDLTILATAIK